MENPAAGSVTKTAFFPLTGVIENGRTPPIAGVDGSKEEEREPSSWIFHAAKNPGAEGGVPLTVTRSLLPSGENTMSDTVFGGPDGGVVWVRLRERCVPSMAQSPAQGSGVKQLVVEVHS
jgi:hypothetical protein